MLTPIELIFQCHFEITFLQYQYLDNDIVNDINNFLQCRFNDIVLIFYLTINQFTWMVLNIFQCRFQCRLMSFTIIFFELSVLSLSFTCIIPVIDSIIPVIYL